MGTAPKGMNISKYEGVAGIIPGHVAIIMDGNGRWAQERGLPRLAGHRAGTDNIRRIIEAAAEWNLKVLTLYAFSTENWRRPVEEVRGLMTILSQVIDREAANLHKNGVRLRHLGSLESLEPILVERVDRALRLTANNQGLTVNVALNYGGRAEIVGAVRRICQDQISADQISEELVSSYLYTADCPDPDLIVRTGGEMRLSNFLIWQAAYAEYWSTPVYWPDFGREQFREALTEYGRRRRRFGALDE
jgi:undecaprenyl diphosphate synthase